MKTIILGLTLLIACFSVSSQSITIGQKDSLFSEALQENRTFSIYLPPSYYQNPNQHYPVLYILDGDYNFHYVTGLIELQSSISENIPEMIVVGISGKGTETYRKNCKPRLDGVEDSGNADIVAEFLKTELIPYVNDNYHSNDYKLLGGHSIGGLFVINTALKNPKLFDQYIAISPALWWGENAINDIAKLEHEKHPNEQPDLYISLADEKGMGVKGFLKSTKNDYAFIKFKNENHNSVGEPTYKWALNAIFKDWKIEKTYFDSNEKFEEYAKKNQEAYGLRFGIPKGAVRITVRYVLNKNEAELTKFGESIQRLYPESYPYFNTILATNFVTADNYEQAEKVLLETLKMAPTNTEVLAQLAEIYLATDKLDAALSSIDQAINFAKKQQIRQWQMNELEDLRERISKKKVNPN